MKAIIVKKTGDTPPRLHNLLRLAEIADIVFDEAEEAFVGELSGYYIQTRYPEPCKELSDSLNRTIAGNVFRKTEEEVQWLFSALK